MASHLSRAAPRQALCIIEVEVVVVHVNCLVAVKLKLPVDLLPVKSQGFLLGHTDEYDAVPRAPLAPEFIGDFVFVLLMPELIYGNVFPLGQFLHGRPKTFRDLSQNHGRRHGLVQLLSHEHHQPQSSGQFADITVEVETVQALNLQRDVPVKEFRNGRHPRIL